MIHKFDINFDWLYDFMLVLAIMYLLMAIAKEISELHFMLKFLIDDFV
jgi:hypothetical protein